MTPIQQYFNSVYQGNSAWWQWLLGIVYIFVICVGVLLLLAELFYVGAGLDPNATDGWPGLANLALLFATFLPLFFGIWLIQRIWHKRTLTQLLTYTSKFRWRNFWNSMFVFLVVTAGFMALSTVFWPEDWDKYQLNTNWDMVIYGGLITLLLVPFQAASEEFLLRGYLNQAFIKYLKSPWIVFIITSAAFASLHYWNSEADGQLYPYMAAIFLFGFAACVLLYFEGGLESAIGLHIINNLFAFGIIGYEDPSIPTIAIMYSGPPEIGWNDVGWEVLSLSLIVAGIIWINRKTAHSKRDRLTKLP